MGNNARYTVDSWLSALNEEASCFWSESKVKAQPPPHVFRMLCGVEELQFQLGPTLQRYILCSGIAMKPTLPYSNPVTLVPPRVGNPSL